MVPSYCVGQSLQYLNGRGFSKKDFSPEQLEAEKWMNTPFSIDENYGKFADARFLSQGYKQKEVECASGKYMTWYRQKDLTKKE